MSTYSPAKSWRDYNPMLLVAVLLLLAISLPMIYSTTIGINGSFDFSISSSFAKHLVWIAVGSSILVTLMFFDYVMLRSLALVLYIVGLGLLVSVLFLGRSKFGAQSWIGSSSLSFQPTEPAKLTVIIALAAFWSSPKHQEGRWISLLLSLALVAPALGLVLLQPDFGSAMVIVGIWLVMSFVGNVRWYQYLSLFALGAPAAVFAWLNVFKPYQRYRLMVFLFPERCKNDPEFAKYCWQTIQSRLAVGNGGLGGMGLLRGTQNQLNYLPVPESDFIFAVTAEELGFIGAALVLLLQFIVIWQIWRVVDRTREPFGRLIAAGIGGMLLVHCFENMGMNLIMMPMTGIPLPFISYGGSFTLTVLAGIGLVQSISLRSRRWEY